MSVEAKETHLALVDIFQLRALTCYFPERSWGMSQKVLLLNVNINFIDYCIPAT